MSNKEASKQKGKPLSGEAKAKVVFGRALPADAPDLKQKRSKLQSNPSQREINANSSSR